MTVKEKIWSTNSEKQGQVFQIPPTTSESLVCFCLIITLLDGGKSSWLICFVSANILYRFHRGQIVKFTLRIIANAEKVIKKGTFSYLETWSLKKL